MYRRKVESWNEGNEQSRLLDLLRDALIKRFMKEEAKRVKSNHTSR